MNTIYIRAGEFHATVYLDLLPDLPIRNIRKIMRLMYSHTYENSESIQTITNWLPEAVFKAKAEWYEASVALSDGWRKVNSRSRQRAVTEIRKKNRMLTNAVKYAKAKYERTIKLQSIFNEIKNKEK